MYNPDTRPNRRYCLQQSRNRSHGRLLRRSFAEREASSERPYNGIRFILEGLSTKPMRSAAPTGTEHGRQATGKETATGQYPHRAGDSIRSYIKKYTGYK